MRLVLLSFCLCLNALGGVQIRDPGRQLSSETLSKLESLAGESKISVFIDIDANTKAPDFDASTFYLQVKTRPPSVQVYAAPELKVDSSSLLEALNAQWIQGGVADVVLAAASYLEKMLNPTRSLRKAVGLGILLFGIILLCSQALSRRSFALWALPLMVVGLFLRYFELYLDPAWALPRDNYRSNFQAFHYIVQYLRQVGSFPDWFFNGRGGIWLDALLNNYLLFAPTHLVGYWVGLKTDWNINQIYKVVVVLGAQLAFAYGTFRLSRKFYSVFLSSALVAVMLLCSPLIGTLHQEQDLVVLAMLPYLWLCFLASFRNPKFLPLLGALFGVSLMLHYPQILALYVCATLSSALLFGKSRKVVFDFFHQIRLHPKWSALALVFLLVSSSPTLYIYFKHAKNLKSEFRGQSEIAPSSYGEYLKQHAIQVTSAYPTDFLAYLLGPNHKPAVSRDLLDDRAFFLSPAVPFVLILSVFLFAKSLGFHLVLLALLCWLSLGIHGGAAHALFYTFPAIKLFRQWYHFYPFFNFHLLFLLLICFDRFPTEAAKKSLWLSGAFLFAFVGITGALAPLFALPACFLFALKLLPQSFPWKERALRFGCWAWILLGSLSWTIESLNQYELWAKYYSPKAQTSRASHLYELFQAGAPLLNVANPKHLGPVPVGSGLEWKLPNGNQRVSPQEVEISKLPSGEFQIALLSIPKDAVSLQVHQYNDGNWESFPHASITSLNTLEFPLAPEIRFARSASAWTTLRWLCWLPLILSLLILVRFSKVPIWDSSRSFSQKLTNSSQT